MVKEKLIHHIQTIAKTLVGEHVSVSITHADNRAHGDYTTNIAFILSKKLKKSPLLVAEELVKELTEKQIPEIQSIQAVAPGFINITLMTSFLTSHLVAITNTPEHILGVTPAEKKQFEMYENTQPNTNKPLHVGHLRNTALGESIVALRKTLGHKVWSVNINNDRGIAIMKAMWGYLQYGKILFSSHKERSAFAPTQPHNWQDLLNEWLMDHTQKTHQWSDPTTQKQKADHFLGTYYMLGDKAEKLFEDHAKDQMKAMLLSWEEGEKDIKTLWEVMNAFFYEGFQQTHARFLQKKETEKQFDHEWYESELYQKGRAIIEENLGKGLFEKRADGVIIAKLENYNLPDKVVIRSDGSSLYVTFDIAQARERVQEYKADLIAHIVGDEQTLYFQQLFAIIDSLGIAPKEHFLHIAYGMVTLKGGKKMSSREGTVITADSLMDMVHTRIQESFKTSKHIAEQIGIGSIKYELLKHNAKGSIAFDIDQSISLEGNSGPYLQYAYARTQSILKKAPHTSDSYTSYTPSEIEHELLQLLFQFGPTVETAALQYAPHIVCEYLFSLAKQFNLFYQKHRIVDAKDKDEQAFRLLLTTGVGTVLQQGLTLLGIATPSAL